MNEGIGLFYLIGFICLYILPGVIAHGRNTRNMAQVWVITIFLGWTFLGWVVALAMAFSANVLTDEEIRAKKPNQAAPYVGDEGWDQRK